MSASEPTPRQLEVDARWSAILRGDGLVALTSRVGRRVFGLVPGRHRCKVCNAPSSGPAALPFRLLGYQKSHKTPHICARCLEWAPEGGVIVPISILFADIRGYTALAESLPPTAIPALLNRFYDIASRVLLRHEAILGQIAGDQVMGLFVPGLSGPRYARNAVASAAALLEAVGYGTVDGPWLTIGVGVATGNEFCGNVGGGGFKDFTAVGDVTNLAARLTARAAAGEAIVDSATREASPEFEFGDVEIVDLKNISAPVKTYRLA